VSEIVVSVRGYEAAAARLQAAAAAGALAIASAMRQIAKVAHREAVKNAPISPTAALLKAARKTDRKVTRKARATSRPKPGGLERSISFMSDGDTAKVFVASNSEAGRYAFRIHNEKGVTWRRRGLGTVAKGGRADEKFIFRAIDQNTDDFRRILKHEIGKIGNA